VGGNGQVDEAGKHVGGGERWRGGGDFFLGLELGKTVRIDSAATQKGQGSHVSGEAREQGILQKKKTNGRRPGMRGDDSRKSTGSHGGQRLCYTRGMCGNEVS